MEHLANILLISLFCVGWCTLLQPSMIFEKLGQFIESLPYKLGKPFGACVPCSASGIGSVAYFLLVASKSIEFNWFMYLFYLVSAVFLNSLIWFARKNLQGKL